MEVELTSARDDGTWTWRAAGARQPKGVLDGSLLPDGASVGDVIRVDVEADLDGLTVVAVLPPEQKKRNEPERLQILGSGASEPAVTTSFSSGRGRGERRSGTGRRGDRRSADGRRGDARHREGRRGDGRRPGSREGAGAAGPRGPRSDRADREPRERRGRPSGATSERTTPDGTATARPRRAAAPARATAPPPPKRPRLRPARTHRKAALEALAPEEQAIAEQVLRGGIPAVRQAVEKQNQQARAAGHPEVKPEPIVAIAERLLPALRQAEWHDRAEAAVAGIDTVDLRDLRSVVVAADANARDDESRELAARVRAGLNQRVEQEHTKWLAELAELLADNRVIRALRLSSRPPKAGVPLPHDLATRLADATTAALAPDVSQERWAAVLDALSFSPVRQHVEPVELPASPSDELLAMVRKVASRLPELAARFGVSARAVPSPRGPRRAPPPPKPAVDVPPAPPTDDARPTEPKPDEDAGDTNNAQSSDSAGTSDAGDVDEGSGATNAGGAHDTAPSDPGNRNDAGANDTNALGESTTTQLPAR